MITVDIKNYPTDLSFSPLISFPPIGDKDALLSRTQYLIGLLDGKGFKHPLHDNADFVVEAVVTTPTGEEWLIGS